MDSQTFRMHEMVEQMKTFPHAEDCEANVFEWSAGGFPLRIVDERCNCHVAEIKRQAKEIESLKIADNDAHWKILAADVLADEVASLVTCGSMNSRSAAADALLDFRNPPRTERSDRITEQAKEIKQLRVIIEEEIEFLEWIGLTSHVATLRAKLEDR